ncbi:hypothetical protein JJB09_20155 [Rhizobium sp. KVB221]|uniref:D-isomer specific 2-hydroxyacid dehydrogenase NAD-binding domain-containing protein n=1 Tax=Rhizobium setariae TaxID=2801340 RepID=A0A936YVR3_9HYPH|nr:NAD(P)-dependent oxidoreductase [Rhizobium setariae]MBL0374337.1 hypothetical protein [Rhizobium setariae]
MRSGKAKVYIDNPPGISPIFEITESALMRHLVEKTQLLGKLEIVFGSGADGFKEGIRNAEILVGWNFPTASLAHMAPRLRWIQLISSGLDHLLPLNWLPIDVLLTRASGTHRQRTDEFVTLSLLMLNNQIPKIVTNKKSGRFEDHYVDNIKGKTTLVLGVGAVGSIVAASARKLRMKTIGIRARDIPSDVVDEVYSVNQLRDHLPRADFVVVATPKTSRTIRLLGRAEMDCMKPGAGIVNLSRLGVVDEIALMDYLGKECFSGVVFDSTEAAASPSTIRLANANNLILTPHSLNNDREHFRQNMLKIFVENLERYLLGKALVDLVDPLREY